jgi:AraC family transcriptional regulator, regulatory protein of adaptative response / methylated-DNA-[protein]-cysteine methyltransferase
MARRSSGPVTTLRFARVETSMGPMWVVETDAGIAAISRSEPFDALERRFPAASVLPGEVDVAWIEDALSGGPLPPVDLGGLSGFDAGVYETVRAVRPGETVTYGEVAAMVGSPGAARAVGGAMSRCPLFPAVPCHRVVRASDGWSGWGGDDGLKLRLLRAEARGAGTRRR